MTIEFVDATAEHVDLMAPRIRPEDVREVYAAVGVDGRTALSYSVLMSTCAWTCMKDGQVAAMFGAANDPSVMWGGQAWLLATPELFTFPIRALHESVKYINEMHRQYKTLSAWVDVRNKKSMAWLNWCGFHPILFKPDYGHEGRPFILYSRASDV